MNNNILKKIKVVFIITAIAIACTFFVSCVIQIQQRERNFRSMFKKTEKGESVVKDIEFYFSYGGSKGFLLDKKSVQALSDSFSLGARVPDFEFPFKIRGSHFAKITFADGSNAEISLSFADNLHIDYSCELLVRYLDDPWDVHEKYQRITVRLIYDPGLRKIIDSVYKKANFL